MEAMVPQKFHKWLKVFGKVESERMPTRKIWDHAIDLKEEFKASKARVYPLSRNEREDVMNCNMRTCLFFSFLFLEWTYIIREVT